MSDSQGQLWSNSPNAPKISYYLYVLEKTTLAGSFIGSIIYGMLSVLFFQCLAALFNPVHCKREGIKWGLVSYTVAMFSFVTVYTAIDLDIHSISSIDNRDFPGVEGAFPSGPIGYRWSVWSGALSVTPTLMFLLNNWLADGLLVYRCYVIYSRNLWAIAFPFIVYLASLAMGIMSLIGQVEGSAHTAAYGSLPSISISVSLNVLLTLMIITRLVLHYRVVHTTMGAPGGMRGSYKTIITMLVESCALFAVNSLVVIGLMVAENHAVSTFLSILAQTQVIAPLLVIQRVASKSALSSDTVAPGSMSSFRARSRGDSIGDARDGYV